MSAGAVFKLIANDGKSDRLIMATKLLQQRIKDVMCARKRAGKADITPTLVDLERTHILYVNSHFKPYAAVGFEYNKVLPQSGNPTLGGGVTFSIPQFGDFFHDMVCRTRLSSFYGNEGLVPTLGSPLYPIIYVYDNNGQPIIENGEQVVDEPGTGILIDAFGETISYTPAPTTVTTTDPITEVTTTTTTNYDPVQRFTKYRNLVRYCEFPGNRLFNLVKFDVNGNPLDQYDQFIPVMLEKFCVPPNKRVGYNRLVGQEVPVNGYGALQTGAVNDADKISASAWNTPSGISKAVAGQSNHTVALFNEVAGTIMNSTSIAALNSGETSSKDVSRIMYNIVNGPQTPKPVQPPLEIWNKLKFWFNDDVRSSIASVSIPFGQRFISIDLCTQAQLAFEYPGIYILKANIGVDPYDSLIEDFAEGSEATPYPIYQSFGTTEIKIEKMELYINNIFVNPEIHDIYIKRIGFSLIRVYRQHTQRCNQEGNDEKLLSQLKWPVEYMFVGLRPVWNTKPVIANGDGNINGNPNVWRDWHRMTRAVDVDNGASLSKIIFKTRPRVEYYLPVPTVDTLSLTSHGISIFDGFSDTFFNQYMPFHYGGANINTPEDVGALFVNMALFPRSSQPSGHLNVSRARETYLKWTSSYVSANTPADLIVVAVAINFLLITDGSAVLRYST